MKSPGWSARLPARLLVAYVVFAVTFVRASAAAPPAGDIVLGNSKVELTFETTATTCRLKSVKNVLTGYVFTQASANLWTITLENKNKSKTVLQPDNVTGFTLKVQQIGANRLAALWSKIAVGADKYNVYVQVDLLQDSAEFSITVQSNQKNYITTAVSYPKLELDPVQSPAFFAPVRQGVLTRDPYHLTHRDVIWPGGTINTGSMQVFSYGDHDQRELLYLQSRDKKNYGKSVAIDSRNGRLALEFVATPVNLTTFGNGYSSPYTVEIGAMHGRWQDAIARYRGWVATAPWVQGGTLEERDDPVITQSPYFMFAAYCEDDPGDCDPNDPATVDGMAETLIQWKDYLGIDASVPIPALWWIYGHPVDSQGKPETYPSVIVYPDTALAIQTANAYGGFIAPHWATLHWTYKSDSYIALNIEPFAMRKKNGAVLVLPNNVVVTNQFFPTLRALHQAALATRIHDDGLSGIYYDVISGFVPSPDYNPGLPSIGGGTSWGDGTKALFAEHKTLFPGQFVMTEYPNELYADLVDICQNNTSRDNIGWYQSASWSLVPGYSMVYHAYERQAPSVGMGLIDDVGLVRVGFYYYAYNFAIGAMMSISATSQKPCYATDPGLIPEGADVFAFQRDLILQEQRFLDYFATGTYLRPLDVETDYVTRDTIFSEPGACADGSCFPQYDSGAGLGVGKVFASAFGSSSSNGVLIPVVNWWEADAPSSVAIDVAELGLDPTKSYDLWDVTTTNQLVGTFPAQFDLVDAAFPARTLRLFKLVEAGTPP